MSVYTTGEIAKLCNVTVRTVQYYDTRGILVPDELTEGGRRLYSEENLKQMKTVCFLRELGLSIDAIADLLSQGNQAAVISLLLEQQEQQLLDEMKEYQEKLDKIHDLKQGLKEADHFSLNSISDIAVNMASKNKLRKMRKNLVLIGIPFNILQWGSIVYWIATGKWWLFAVWLAFAIPYSIVTVGYYYRRVIYICPECNERFRSSLKEFCFAAHTPATRKLTCTVCGHKGYCVEAWDNMGGK